MAAPGALLAAIAVLAVSAPTALTAEIPAIPSSSAQLHYNQTAPGTGSAFVTENLESEDPACDCVCGIARRTRIVGGDEAREAEFPWLAALSRRGKFYCGGALVSKKHVLTAAHCMYGMTPSDISVTLGAHNRSSSKFTPGRVERRVRKAMVHEKFDVSNFNNDIALLELDRDVHVEAEESVARTVCLPSGEREYSGQLATVAGWGRIAEKKPTSDVLRKVSVPLMSQDDCRQAGYPAGRITENMLCAGYPTGLKDACQGDSGGPLLMAAEHGPSSEVIGIVSWGRGCARPNFPGVYTRVHRFLPWLREKLGSTCTCNRAA